MWIVLISPYESSTHNWTVKQFDTEAAAFSYVKGADLTKEHYVLPVESVVHMLRKTFED
jgi:hypothetical protein